MAKLVSKVYGDALFEAALEDNRLSSLSDEVTAVKEIIAANDDLSKLMDHPQIDKEEKVRIIEEIFGEDRKSTRLNSSHHGIWVGGVWV